MIRCQSGRFGHKENNMTENADRLLSTFRLVLGSHFMRKVTNQKYVFSIMAM